MHAPHPIPSPRSNEPAVEISVPPDQEVIVTPRNGWQRLTWVAVVLAAAYTVHAAAGLVLSIVVAMLLALLLAPAVKWLVRVRVPQALAAALVMLSMLGIIGGLAANLIDPVQKWASFGPSDLRMIDRKLKAFVKPVQSMQEVADRVADIAVPVEDRNKREVVVERGNSFSMFTGVPDAVFAFLTTLMLAYFLLASGDTFLRKAVRMLPKMRDKIRVVEMAREVQTEIGRYFLTITLLSAMLGIATSLAMWALGMPTPLLWGVIAALLNFVPYLGPIISLVIIAAVSVFTFQAPLDIVAPPAVFLLLHFLEGQVAEPMIMGNRFSINPVVIFIWVLIWGWLGGAIGVLIAVPLLVALRICASRIDGMAPFVAIIGNDQRA